MKKIYLKLPTIVVLLLCVSQTFAQTLNNIAPSIGMEGTSLSVSISGQNSNFLQGTTTVWFNQGSSTIYASNVSVNNATSLIAQVGIPYGTPLGLYQTNVQDPIDNIISNPNSFTIVANPNSPVITNVSPATTMEGTSLTVTISGQNTNFQQGTTTVWFNQGSSTIYASSVNVNSAINLDAFFNIPFGTPLGLYGTNIQDPIDNLVTLPNSFTITANPNAPELVNITPNNGDLGTTIPVTISGQNTNFLQGTGTLVFVQGSSTLFTSNIIYNSNSQLGVTLTIPNNAYPGYYDVYFNNPLDGTMLLVDGFYVNPPPCGNVSVDITQQPCPGGFATINITGGFAPYTAIIDGQSFNVGNNFLDYYPTALGNYTITSVVDNFGCTATSIDSIIHYDEFSATLSGANACQGTSISLTNTIVSSASISFIYYYFGNGSASSGNTVTYNTAGIYYPFMEVYNSNGCAITVDANTPIEIYSTPQNSILSLTDATCGLTNGEFEIVGVGNGPFNYAVTGVGGYNSTSTINTSLASGNYNVSISDNNACASNTGITIANISTLTNITGNIQTSTGANANNTTVNLLSLTDTIGAMAVSYNTLTDANGNYSFANLAEGNYILLAEPDNSLFPNEIATYKSGSHVWYNADTIQINCSSQNLIDVQLLGAIPQFGAAQLDGIVFDYSYNPYSNVGMVLYDNNSNQAITRTITDANGIYNFTGIDAGYYSILVDVPGLILNTFYTFNLNANDALYNRNYFADYGNRIIDTVWFLVGIKENIKTEIKIFPNPFNEQTTISYNLPTASNVNIEVYNYIGQKVETIVNESKPAGAHRSVFSTSDKAKGVYFIKVTSANTQKIFKIVSVE